MKDHLNDYFNGSNTIISIIPLDNTKIYPTSIQITEGKSYNITCFGGIVDKWYYESPLLIDSMTLLPSNAVAQGNNLIINRSTWHNEGMYICEGISSEINIYNNKHVRFMARSKLYNKSKFSSDVLL